MNYKEVTTKDKNKSGIYRIINLINNKIYVGQASDLWDRINRGHVYSLNNNRSKNKHLQRSWNKYGRNNFKFEVLEYCSLVNLNEREQYWINTTNCCNINIGYNISPTAGSRLGVPHSKEAKIKISNATKGNKNGNYGRKHTDKVKKDISEQNRRPVVQLDLKGNFIKEWYSIKNASEFYNINTFPIIDCCQGNGISSCGFVWLYKDDYNKNEFNIIEHYEKDGLRKLIVQLDKNNNLIKIWRSTADAKRKLKINNIGGCLMKVIKSSGGFKWMYLRDYLKINFLNNEEIISYLCF